MHIHEEKTYIYIHYASVQENMHKNSNLNKYKNTCKSISGMIDMEIWIYMEVEIK